MGIPKSLLRILKGPLWKLKEALLSGKTWIFSEAN
jgi:hypothetical protein